MDKAQNQFDFNFPEYNTVTNYREAISRWLISTGFVCLAVYAVDHLFESNYLIFDLPVVHNANYLFTNFICGGIVLMNLEKSLSRLTYLSMNLAIATGNILIVNEYRPNYFFNISNQNFDIIDSIRLASSFVLCIMVLVDIIREMEISNTNSSLDNN